MHNRQIKRNVQKDFKSHLNVLKEYGEWSIVVIKEDKVIVVIVPLVVLYTKFI